MSADNRIELIKRAKGMLSWVVGKLSRKNCLLRETDIGAV